MKTLKELADSIDYKLLREQKSNLLFDIIESDDPISGYAEAIEGLLALIDNLQDTIVEAGLKTEEEVFDKNL